MSEPEFVDPSEWPLVADESYITEQERLRELAASNGAGDVAHSSWEPLDLSELDDVPPVPPTLGGLGIMYPGKRHIFSGPQESAKTLAAYAIALEVVRLQGLVVLIDFEMGRWDTRNRLRELGASKDELRAVAYVEPAEKATQGDIEGLMALEPALVLIDAAAGAFDLQGLDDNKRSDVERFAGVYVNRFWRSGIATLVLDHVVKNVETRGAYAIGSERKVGGCDVHLGFTTVHPIKRGGSGTYKVVTHKDRGGFLKRGKLADFEIRSDPDTHALTWAFRPAMETDEEHPFRPTTIMEKVSRFLELQQQAVSLNTVKTAKLGKHEYVDLALSILSTEGYVEETEGPNRARLFESVEVYREDSDEALSGSPQVRPEFAPESGITSSPVRPSPYGGGKGDEFAPAGEPSSPQGSLDDDDGIPF